MRLALVVVFACGADPVTAPAPGQKPVAPVAAFPEPPQQHAAWTPPETKLDTKAVARLFDQGAADPRGCDYRDIEIEVTAGHDDAATRTKTHGWVLPDKTFAIAWNGLVYRTLSTGAAASVDDDIGAALDAAVKARDEAKRDDPGLDWYPFPVSDEGTYVATTTIAPSKVMMLLRLGNAALAERVWAALGLGDNLYAHLADDWLWAQYGRGVGAHRRGDVALAIESWRRLPGLAAAARTDVTGDGIIAGDQGARYLDDIAALLADEQRRAAHPSAPIDLRALAQLPAADRIAKLIDALDQVSTTGFEGVDPIVKALANEGDAAVEPLLAVYEHDERRTRSRFVDIKHGDNDRDRHIIPVYEVAYQLLAQLVDTSYFQPTTQDRRALAAELRAYWKKWHGVSRVERQYLIFADDSLDESRWYTAAIQITSPYGGRLYGEALRGKTPTVTSLFERRLVGFSDFRQRAQMLVAFAAWDAAGAKAELAKTARAGFAGWAAGDAMDPYLGQALVELTTARIAAGDTAALGDYAAWIVTTTPEQAQFAALSWFAPMIAHPDEPETTRAATALFGGKSPWVPLTSKRAGYYLLDVLGSEMTRVPAFRAHVLVGLADHTKLGTMTMKHGSLDVQTEAFQQSAGVDGSDPRLPADGWTGTLRVCDQYAASLVGGRSGAPAFQRYWPVADRDRAIADIAKWLTAP